MHKLLQIQGGRHHGPPPGMNKPLPEPLVDPDEGKTPIGKRLLACSPLPDPFLLSHCQWRPCVVNAPHHLPSSFDCSDPRLLPLYPGEIVIVPIQGRDLPNRERFGKQDPFILFKCGNVSKRSSTDIRGGQRPRWNDDQVRTVDLSFRAMEGHQPALA